MGHGLDPNVFEGPFPGTLPQLDCTATGSVEFVSSSATHDCTTGRCNGISNIRWGQQGPWVVGVMEVDICILVEYTCYAELGEPCF